MGTKRGRLARRCAAAHIVLPPIIGERGKVRLLCGCNARRGNFGGILIHL